MNEKLASLRKVVEEPSKQEITMVYLDESGDMHSMTLPIKGDEPTDGEWRTLVKETQVKSYRVFEVLSINNKTVIVPDGPVLVGTPDDRSLLEALGLADANREYYFSARR